MNIIKRLADLVVDYMGEKIDCDIGNDFKLDADGINNKDWFRTDNSGTPIDRDWLKNNGYISDSTYETIGERRLQTIATDTFANLGPGDTKTSVIYANTILVNEEGTSVYDNHVEIIGINAKTGRTIKNVEDTTRQQVDKTYQPGNYIPTLGSEHQQDDDRVRITVTPPTGTTIYTTIYIISAVVGLIVIVGGIVLIKKKVMKK